MAPIPHWLAKPGKTWTPEVIVTFDTETTEYPEGDQLVQIMRCWDSKTRLRHGVCPTLWRSRNDAGTEPRALADVAEFAASLTREAWVFAYNLGFDLAVSSLPFLLVARGWDVDAFHLGDESCWWVLKHGKQKLVLTDSWSWVRCDLATIGKEIGMRKVPLPGADDALETWHKRCKRDVAILDKLMTTILDWWDTERLGRFALTGAGCGWAAMRAKTKSKSILVGPDPERTTFERRAIHSGRKEVYVVGQFAGEWFADYDFVDAYLTTVAAFPLPCVPRQFYDQVPLQLATSISKTQDVIAEVEITTDRPCAPVKIDDEVWWPTGTFRTVLTGPEIRYCLDVAQSVKLGAGWSYKMSYALADWAGWCLGVRNNHGPEDPPVVRRMAKSWGRSVPGRFASRTSRVIAERPATHLGWHLETGHDLVFGHAIDVVSFGGRELTLAKDQNSADCFPAVLAFVESYCRVALAQVLDTREPTRLLQCNTDGWWERRAVRSTAYQVEHVPAPYRIVRKALENRLVVLGPNHVKSPHERRFAGIPRNAEATDHDSFRWHDWPGFRWQLEHGEQGTYTRPLRDAMLQDHYVRRWVLSTGETIPATAAVGPADQTIILPWSETLGRLRGDVLADHQVDSLEKLRDEPPILLQPEVAPGRRQPGRQRIVALHTKPRPRS